MENYRFLTLTLAIAAGIFLQSCVRDDDFEIPLPGSAHGQMLETNTTLSSVLGMMSQGKGEVVTFKDDLVLAAYVVSCDEAGNFYKELIIQDKPENPSAGIAVQINLASSFGTYDFGRKVYLKLRGLSVGQKNGVAVLGVANGKQIEQIPLARIQDFISRSSEVAEIKPLPVRAVDFTDRMENLYVQLDDVQFSKYYIGSVHAQTFAGEANDEFDGERQLESCSGDFPVVLSTSTYANFKALKLPDNTGSVRGILTRDYYDKFFTIYLNSFEDIKFTRRARCDVATFDCGLAGKPGRKVLFAEEFTGTNNKPVSGKSWTNHIQEGSRAWEVFTATGANATLGKSARVRPAGSGDYKTVSWLITPGIDFNLQEGEVLNFKTSTSFANHSMLEVLFSNDWDGTVENFERATWKILSAAYIADRADFFGDWMSSGNVDLSCATGMGYIAFKYKGSDTPYYNGIFELDDIFITAE